MIGMRLEGERLERVQMNGGARFKGNSSQTGVGNVHPHAKWCTKWQLVVLGFWMGSSHSLALTLCLLEVSKVEARSSQRSVMDYDDNQELTYPPVPLNKRYLKHGKLKPDLALPRPADSKGKFRRCRWVAPAKGWFRMDCDASFIVERGSIGVVFRNWEGKPIAIVHDAFKLLKFEVVFHPSNDYSPEVQQIVDQIKVLLNEHYDMKYHFYHVHRQANFVANHLSKPGLVPGSFYYCPSHFTTFKSIRGMYDACPFDETLYYFINRDANGPSFTRYDKDYIHPMDRGEPDELIDGDESERLIVMNVMDP
ncbi:hypothetical protein BVC80_929g5 [Macleaya cordata]|uniref:RNase H type-1 domain-containing protein n=1 Tax=Macleaya cordata TaxID=56857 RepID=A0A200Q188_MACCD|nr:hypothetical protein BVC80_929g5 [Macleaya cordata]